MVVVPYMGKYFGRKCAYWGEFFALMFVLFCFVWGRGGRVQGLRVGIGPGYEIDVLMWGNE